ncbi:MAG: ethanolamine ammonia-lyase light chain EutC, partial [Pseudomonadaceae bacterium]
MPNHTPATENPWQQLRQLTPARIALGRAGTSLPTRAQLDFQFAHAQARDAVHLPFDHAGLREELHALGHTTLLLHSAASDLHTYLQRPDLGRRLGEASAAQLDEHVRQHGGGHDLAIVIADGLSYLAVIRHSLPILQ